MYRRESDCQQYFKFVRYAIDAEKNSAPCLEGKDWRGLFQFAKEQAIVGMVFEAVKRLGEQGVKPPFNLLMEWIGLTEQIAKQNKILNRRCVEVVREYQDKGFRGCILKGQGNALMYDRRRKKEEGRSDSLAMLRTPGDIDIWLEGGREKIMKMVNENWPGQLVRYHHVEIPSVGGIPVEIHFFPSYMHAPWRNKRLQEWFAKQADGQFANHVTLPGTDEQISVPTAEFNVVYQLQHMFSHLFTEGFGLRQVVDYYFVLRAADFTDYNDNNSFGDILRHLTSATSVATRQCVNEFPLGSLLSRLGLWKFARAMMWVMKEVLQLDSQYMIAEPNEKEGRFLLSEIMQSGNMGHYDTRLGKTEGEGVVHRYLRMTLRNMRFIKHYPEEALCEPLFRTWYYFWRKFH